MGTAQQVVLDCVTETQTGYLVHDKSHQPSVLKILG